MRRPAIVNHVARTKAGLAQSRFATLLSVALLASCHAPSSTGVYVRREAYGAIILHLSGEQSGRVEGDIAFSRLGVDGGVHVFARKLAGMRDGDLVRLRDPGGTEVRIALAARGARMTAPDGRTIQLERTDSAGENALLADLAGQAKGMRDVTPSRSRSSAATRSSPIIR